MSTNSTIDDLFKDGLNDMNFSNREAIWKKMEKELDDKKRKKKRMVFGLLLCCLLAGGFFAVNNTMQNNKALPATKIARQQSINLKENSNINSGESFGQHVSNSVLAGTSAVKNKPVISSVKRKATKGSLTISTVFDIGENVEGSVVAERAVADFNLLPYASFYKPAIIKPDPLAKPITKLPVKEPEIKQQKFSLELVAGSDIFNLNKKVGYYTGIRISKHLDKGTSVSVGINYSFNTLNEKYRLSNKPLQQQDMDAQVNSLKMLRFPVMFQRQVPKTKFALMAGLIPSYILDASVYNVPNSNAGNPNEYRRFTIDDIHRFNILFGAGIKYAPFKKIAFELSGSYGFTEMVKDSYINQSNVNDNFKNIQAGVVFMLK